MRLSEPSGRWRNWAPLVFGSVLLAACLPATAAPGISDSAVVFGQSAGFSGPSGHLGNRYRAGILAAFRERNARGGVGGRVLELVSVDDAYEPEQAAANARRFVTENDVFAVIGGVGTPTARRIVPVLRSAGIPFVGPFTGADFLRNAERNPNVVNLRAGYFDETEVLVAHLIDQHQKPRIGIIYQGDSFGRTVLANLQGVLEGYDLPILAKTTFTRNTHAVHASLFPLLKADLDAILLVGTYSANAAIINLATALGYNFLFSNMSFVSSIDLDRLVEKPRGHIMITEVVPDVADTTSAVVQRFREAIAVERDYHPSSAADHLINTVALEGYILGRFVISVLERLDGEPTRERFLSVALSPEPVAIDDWIIEFEPGTNTGSEYVRLSHLGDR